MDLVTTEQTEPALTRSRSKPDDWYENCADKLRSIGAMEEDWDSYGANAPSSLALHYAHAFLHHIRTVVGVAEPTICAARDGSICFEWEDDIRLLTTRINDRGEHHYYFEGCDEELEGSTFNLNFILHLLTRLK